MSEDIGPGCRKFLEDLWSCWPRSSDLPGGAIRHAEGCAACRAELDFWRELCRRSSAPDGSPLSWAKALPASRWARLDASTREALDHDASRPPLWAPAAALAAAAVLFAIWSLLPSPTARPAAGVPAEVVQNMDLLEHLDLIENWDMIEAVVPEKKEGKRL